MYTVDMLVLAKSFAPYIAVVEIGLANFLLSNLAKSIGEGFDPKR